MAVTVSGRSIRMTAEGDEVALPIKIKSVHWEGASAEGDLMELTESNALGSTSERIYRDRAPGTHYVGRALIEAYYPKGVRVNDLDSGEVIVIYE